jgi:hypothetical protein
MDVVSYLESSDRPNQLPTPKVELMDKVSKELSINNIRGVLESCGASFNNFADTLTKAMPLEFVTNEDLKSGLSLCVDVEAIDVVFQNLFVACRWMSIVNRWEDLENGLADRPNAVNLYYQRQVDKQQNIWFKMLKNTRKSSEMS